MKSVTHEEIEAMVRDGIVFVAVIKKTGLTITGLFAKGGMNFGSSMEDTGDSHKAKEQIIKNIVRSYMANVKHKSELG